MPTDNVIERVNKLLAIVRDLAATEPEVDESRLWCFFCGADASQDDDYEHEAGCVWDRARKAAR